jgi:eukaryotic-like serine/threonine-protein kinase
MPTLTTQHEPALRALFDSIAELPADIRAAKIAALNLPKDKCLQLRAMLAFDELLDIPVEIRKSKALELGLPEEVRIRVQEMLAADGGTTDLRQVLAANVMELLRNEDDESLEQSLIDTNIGTFRLTALIGEGGSSTVFRAERKVGDGLQIVALKLLRTGLYTVDAQRRFRREQAILAQLTHPNIARLVEGGVSVFGIPYIAMELVDGVPITRAADERRLPVEQRLAWFVTLCRTIEAAHSALIVHRDLKPSNLLVTREGDLRVLDFGIAKLLDNENASTWTQSVALTPEYAAPEQFGMAPLTTAVDVYALGMVLGELLTGQRLVSGLRASNTLNASDNQTQPALNGLPKRSALARQLRGDLDAVLTQALAAEPTHRYRSAGAFADDIERYLTGQPVRAHPPSRWYRLRKFFARHRVGVLISSAVVLVVLSSLAVAVRQAHIARQEVERANIVRNFVVGVFEAARVSLPRDQRPTPESLVVQASVQLASANHLDAATRADLNRTLGEVWLSLSSFKAADTAFKKGLEYAVSTGDQEAQIELVVLRADGWQRAGRSADAIAAVEPLLAHLKKQPSRMWIRALHVAAAAEAARDKQSKALAYQREAAAVTTTLFGKHSIEAIAANLEVGNTLVAAGSFTQAIGILEPLLAQWRSVRAPEDDRYVRGLNSLMNANDALGRYVDSEAQVREIIEVKRRIYPALHDSTAVSIRDLAQILERKGNHAGAETLLNEALSIQRKLFGEDHSEVAESLSVLGYVKSAQRHFPEAERYYLKAIAICERAQISVDVCARAHNNLGQIYYVQDRFSDAEREMRIALFQRQQLYGESHPDVAMSMSTLANVMAIRGNSAQAVKLSAGAVATLERAGRGQSREAALARNGYADALYRAGRHEEALNEINRALLGWTRINPDEKVRHVLMLALKGLILKSLGRMDQVRDVVRQIRSINAPQSEFKPSALSHLRELDEYTDAD